MSSEDSDFEEPSKVKEVSGKPKGAKSGQKPSLSKKNKEVKTDADKEKKVQWGSDSDEHSNDIPPVTYKLKAPKSLASGLGSDRAVINGVEVLREGKPTPASSAIRSKQNETTPHTQPPNMPSFETPSVKMRTTEPVRFESVLNGSGIPSHGPDAMTSTGKSLRASVPKISPVLTYSKPTRHDITPLSISAELDDTERIIGIFALAMKGSGTLRNNLVHAIGAVIAVIPDGERYFPLDDVASILTHSRQEESVDWLLSKLRSHALSRDSN